jgi:hypothetical protein
VGFFRESGMTPDELPKLDLAERHGMAGHFYPLELNISKIGINSGCLGQAIILLRQEFTPVNNGSPKQPGNSTHVKTGFFKR